MWRKREASVGQLGWLKRVFADFNADRKTTRGKASDAIARISFGVTKKMKNERRALLGQEKKEKKRANQLHSLKPTLE